MGNTMKYKFLKSKYIHWTKNVILCLKIKKKIFGNSVAQKQYFGSIPCTISFKNRPVACFYALRYRRYKRQKVSIFDDFCEIFKNLMKVPDSRNNPIGTKTWIFSNWNQTINSPNFFEIRDGRVQTLGHLAWNDPYFLIESNSEGLFFWVYWF